MNERPLRTTVIGSYPFPGWLEYATGNLDDFGYADLEEMIDDAVTVAIADQTRAGLDVITDGEQTRLDFNLSFYGFLEGIDLEGASPRLHGPPAHDQRGKHEITGDITAPNGLGTVEDFERFKRLAPTGENAPIRKASVPGPFTMSGRLLPNAQYKDRYAITEALVPIIRQELADLLEAGCTEITVDEPSMSCYGYKEDTKRFVDIYNRTVESIVGKCNLSTHLCFGNFKGHAVGRRKYAPLFPDFLDMHADEVHLEMASREFAELDVIAEVAKTKHVAIGIVDVKSYYIESVADIVERVKRCLEHAPAEKLSFAPDCGLSQTARWAAKQKMNNMVAGVHEVRAELSL